MIEEIDLCDCACIHAELAPRRRCNGCTTYLRQGNRDDYCSACQGRINQPILDYARNPHRINNTGFTGVYRSRNKYRWQISLKGVKHCGSGLFDTATQASADRAAWIAKRESR